MKKPIRIDSAHMRDAEKNKHHDNTHQYSQHRLASESSPMNNASKFHQQQNQLDPKWSEIKIFGKNICRRSYHSSAIHENKMYIYGGYEVNEGILGDFYEMMWNKVALSKYSSSGDKPLQPGPLMRHSAVTYKDKMFIYGGNQQSLKPSNQLWSFDFNEDEWELVKPNGNQVPPSLDSHAATIDESNNCMFIFGGFSDNQKEGGYQNKVWKYHFESQEWTLLGENSSLKPHKRAGSSICLSGQSLYMFGGTIVDVKFNDTWVFDINTEQWEQLKFEKDEVIPETRNGHTFLNYKEKLILFGGIHDITHEKNDMYVFNAKTKKWSVVDDNTSHNKTLNEDILAIDQSITNGFTLQNESIFKDQNKKFYTESSQLVNHRNKTKNSSLEKSKAKAYSPTNTTSRLLKQSIKKQNESIVSREETQPANNQLEENRKRRLLIKKMNLLSEFELNEVEKVTLRPVSPTTETMKNSIVTVGNPIGKNKYSLKILDSSMTRISNPSIDQRQNKMIGRRPCARDGHSAVICDNQCFIFGGDRHMMSYNDLYSVDLDKIIENLQ